jgi:hypothetical protein
MKFRAILYNYIEETHFQSFSQFSDHLGYPRRRLLLPWTIISFFPQRSSLTLLPWIEGTDGCRSAAMIQGPLRQHGLVATAFKHQEIDYSAAHRLKYSTFDNGTE